MGWRQSGIRTGLNLDGGLARSGLMYKELNFYSLTWFLSLCVNLAHFKVDVFTFLTLDVNAVAAAEVAPLVLQVEEAVDVHASSGGPLSGSLFVINRP